MFTINGDIIGVINPMPYLYILFFLVDKRANYPVGRERNKNTIIVATELLIPLE